MYLIVFYSIASMVFSGLSNSLIIAILTRNEFIIIPFLSLVILIYPQSTRFELFSLLSFYFLKFIIIVSILFGSAFDSYLFKINFSNKEIFLFLAIIFLIYPILFMKIVFYSSFSKDIEFLFSEQITGSDKLLYITFLVLAVILALTFSHPSPLIEPYTGLIIFNLILFFLFGLFCVINKNILESFSNYIKTSFIT